jgi:hypothetical protein
MLPKQRLPSFLNTQCQNTAYFISMLGLYLGRELRDNRHLPFITPTVSGETNSFSNVYDYIIYLSNYRRLEGSMRIAGPIVEVKVSFRK